MKKCANLGGLVIILGVLGSLWLGSQANAQVDAFTFFIPLSSEDLARQFAQGRTDYDAFINADIEMTISIAILNNNTVIYYDHWEDGLEAVLTLPDQASTQVWGDGNPNNGIPPGFSSDILQAGEVISLNNDVLVPRTDPPNQIFFDGGDKLVAEGGAVSVSMAAWPIREPPRPPQDGGDIRILYADAWELYTTSRWGNEYVIPIGENLVSSRRGFTVVGVNIQAVEDNTQVQLDLDANGSFETSTTLAEGKQYHVPTGVIAGARVRSSNPIQVQLAASDPIRTYELRGYTLVPLDQWTNDYLAPRTSDGDLWLYNPHSSDLLVNVTSITQTVGLTIPPRSTAKFPTSGLLPRTGLHVVAPNGQAFTGLAALDADSAQDWGYVLLPTANLSTQALISWGLGNYNQPPGPVPVGTGFESRLYVTALEQTTIQVDYNNDGVVEATFDVNPLEEIFITDPQDFDMTGAFVFTTNGVPFAAVWGQDQEANPAQPSIDAGYTIVPIAALDIQKTFTIRGELDCNSVVSPRDLVRFKLHYTNNTALDTLYNVVIRDDLPPELIYIPNSTQLNGVPVADASEGTPYLLDGPGLDVGILPARASGTIIFDTRVSETAVGVVFNLAEISVISSIQVFDVARVKIPIRGQVQPILEFSKTLLEPAGSTVSSGQILTFGLTITNTSNKPVVDLPVRDRFDPTELTFLQAVPSPDLVTSGVITWNNLLSSLGLSTLPPGGQVNTKMSFVVNSLPTTVVTLTNVADLVGVELAGSPRPLNCSTFINLAVGPPPPPTSTATATPDDDDDDDDTPSPPTVTPSQTSAVTPGTGTAISTPGTATPATGTPGETPSTTETPGATASTTGTPGPGTPPGVHGTGGPEAQVSPGAGTGVSPEVTSTVLPVNLLPETGSREVKPDNTGNILLLALFILGTGSLIYLVLGAKE